ncbi:MAG: hypothetical protein QHJ73_17350, partial [Armatimonadota bacterium]|nr:hypothetical protein [Armatimonadota bacterium]
DYRDCESPLEWASVFNYLYHEYLPTFQSNPHAGDTVMAAYCFANGEMPHLVPSPNVGPGPALVNGGFEEWTGTALKGWEKVPGYEGKVWSGRFYRDGAEKHSGTASLRLENALESEVVQVSQNVPVGGGFAVGRRYRLSAWLKTEHLAKPNAVNLGTFAPGVVSTGAGGRISFPQPGAGWRLGWAEFTLPEGSAFLRIMVHVDGPAKVWVDDVTLEEVLPGGTVREVQRAEVPPDHALMRRWVELYHGEGRSYLLFGRMLRPPRLDTAAITYRDRRLPAIFHNAFRAPDGTEAVVLVNGTTTRQAGTLYWKGHPRRVEVEPLGAMLMR